MPRKHEILKRARDISTERAVIHGLPAITPTEAELKESGVYREARIGLMRGASSEAFAEQERYVSEMASEMGLVLSRRREHREQLRKVEAFDIFKQKYPTKILKVNGYKIVVPSLPKRKAQPRKPKTIIPRMPQIPKVMAILKPKPKPKQKRIVVRKIRGTPITMVVNKKGEPLMSGTLLTLAIHHPDADITKGAEKLARKMRLRPTVKPKRKRQKLHTRRNGKTMRKLRKRMKNGVKSFSFPDHVWKVRKP